MDFDLKVLDEVEQIIKVCVDNPEAFLSVQEELSEDLKKATKKLYDLAIRNKLWKNQNSEALPELIIDNFDTEQIWQQIEIANNEVLDPANLKDIFKLFDNKEPLASLFNDDEDLKFNKSEHSDDDNDNEGKENEKKEIKQEGEAEFELKKTSNSKKQKYEVDNKIILSKAKKRKRKTEVDDKFFKLDELNEYLKKEEKSETNPKTQNNDSSDEDVESIDLFDNLSDFNDEENEDDEIKNGRSLKYADFFDSPESCDENEEELNAKHSENENNNGYGYVEDSEDSGERLSENSFNSKNENKNLIQEQNSVNKQKNVKFNLLEPSNDDSQSTNDSSLSDQEDETNINIQSSLEKRQERLSKRIKELEKESIADKPWQLKGETSASSRPQNSLLEEYVEFDAVSRPAPVMTEQTTMKLEDIIRSRIKDQLWDDVEKKFKPVESPMEYKKKLIMNQEKSKESLAQIYENEYLKQREALNLNNKDEQEKQEPPEHIEIIEEMHSLFRKLDALCNFHYTPKAAKPEIKIISNVPAINMEEVAPVAISEANLLAPEEVKSKHKGDLIGKSERTKTDMKRERRKKKLKQHTHYLNESKKLTENVKQKKSLKTKISTKKLSGRNVINADQMSKNDGKSLKSSTAFFAQLQDQIESSIKLNTNKSTIKKTKNKNRISAVKLKL